MQDEMVKNIPISKLTKRQAELVGTEIIKLFKLKVDKETGYVATTAGDKSIEGVGRIVERLYQELPLVDTYNTKDAQGESIHDSNIKLATYGGTNA